jgi:hypothetical protein
MKYTTVITPLSGPQSTDLVVLDMKVPGELARQHREHLEIVWSILNEATARLASRIVNMSPDIYVSLRRAKSLIS